MCGRYTIHTPLQVIADLFEVDNGPALVPRYNVAPTQDVPVVRFDDDHHRELMMMRWGLVPFWAKDPKIGNSLINARSESLAEKPAYRNAFKSRRCLVVADGFYEWKKTPEGKQAYWIHLKSGEPFAFAGLWEHWKAEDGSREITSCTIITTEPNAFVAALHDRMPAILPREDYDAWLNPKTNPAHPVSTMVNSPRNDDAACIAPLGQQLNLIVRKA
jgi:putative SOS response-associated peptidase YedK